MVKEATLAGPLFEITTQGEGEDREEKEENGMILFEQGVSPLIFQVRAGPRESLDLSLRSYPDVRVCDLVCW